MMDCPTQAETQQFWQHGLWKIGLMVCERQNNEVAAVIDSYIFKSLLEIGEAVSPFVTCLFCSLNKL
jgi:hypothetical protein